MPSAPDRAAAERILVVADGLPTWALDGWSSRALQLTALLGSVDPQPDITLLATGVGTGPRPQWSAPGVRVATPGSDLRRWAEDHAGRFGVVVVCGPGGAHRARVCLAPTQPGARVVVDTAALASLRRPALVGAIHPEEEAGERTAMQLRRDRDRQLLGWATDVVASSRSEADHALALDGDVAVFVLEPAAAAPAGPAVRGAGVVAVVLAPHSEFGEPDLEAVNRIADEVWPIVAAAEPSARLRIVLDRQVAADLRYPPDTEVVHRCGPLEPHLVDAAVCLMWRDHGATPWETIAACAATGTRIVASPSAARAVDEPARWNMRVVEPGAVSSAVVHELRRPDPAPAVAPATDPDELLASLGLITGRDAGSPAPVERLAIRGRDVAVLRWARGRDDEAPADWPPSTPLISVLVPVYDTPLDVLDDMVDSVRAQTYPNWELCLVDDASPRQEVRGRLRDHAASDDRIRVTEREVNGGIAAASNTALAMARGTYVALLDHDDELVPEALERMARLLVAHPDLDMVYSDEDKIGPDGDALDDFAKPAWSPDLHMSYNYTTHLSVYRRELLERLGGWREGFDGAQDYDLSLRVSESTDRIGHLPAVLYRWRVIEGSTSAGVDEKPEAWDAGRRALEEALERRGTPGRVDGGMRPGSYRTRYDVIGDPVVGILIPTRDRVELMRVCVGDLDRVNWGRREVLIVDNDSCDEEALSFFAQHRGPVVRYPHRFSYARMMNIAAEQSDADLLLLLNNDTVMIDRDWIAAMVEHAQRDSVGAVGARLVFPDGRVQHEGIALGVGGVASNVDARGYFSLGQVVRNCWAVTAACMMVRPEVFWQVGGFEERLTVAYNDVDLAMRIHDAGYDVVYTPYATLFHAESASRGSLHPEENEKLFERRWGAWEDYVDPYYNPRLSEGIPYFFRDAVRRIWVPEANL